MASVIFSMTPLTPFFAAPASPSIPFFAASAAPSPTGIFLIAPKSGYSCAKACEAEATAAAIPTAAVMNSRRCMISSFEFELTRQQRLERLKVANSTDRIRSRRLEAIMRLRNLLRFTLAAARLAFGPACHGGGHARPSGSLRGRGATRAHLERINMRNLFSAYRDRAKPPRLPLSGRPLLAA